MSVDPLTCPADQLPGLEEEPTPIGTLLEKQRPWAVLALDDEIEARAMAGPS